MSETTCPICGGSDLTCMFDMSHEYTVCQDCGLRVEREGWFRLCARVSELERERDEYRRGIRAIRAFYCIEYLPDGTDLLAGASASDEVNAALNGVRGAMAQFGGAR